MEIRARLDKNESPVDVPESIKHRMLELGKFTEFSRYEGPYRDDLIEALSKAHGVAPDTLTLTNGADEAVLICALAFGGPGVSVIIPSPSFITYPDAALWSHSKIVDVPRLLPDFHLDIDRLVAAAEQARREAPPNFEYSSLVYLCRPNNPSGNLCSEEEVERLLNVPGCMVVVDEAYYEFSGATVVPWVESRKNLITLRTFSKAYCIAGLRLGYMIAARETTGRINKHRLYFNVNVFTQAAALVALNERPYFLRFAGELKGMCKDLQEKLSQISGVTVLPSVTNFVLFSTPFPAVDVKAKLASRGIMVTAYPKEPSLAHHIRVSVGTREENALFLRELESCLRASD